MRVLHAEKEGKAMNPKTKWGRRDDDAERAKKGKTRTLDP